MKISSRLRVVLVFLVSLVLVAIVLAAVYTGSIPEKYMLRPGDVSPYDIVAPRSIRDQVETERRAARAAAEVGEVILRSDEIVKRVVQRLDCFLELIRNDRADPPMKDMPSLPLSTSTSQETDSDGNPLPTVQPEPTRPPVQVIDTEALSERISLMINRELNLIISQNDSLVFASVADDRLNRIENHVESISDQIMSERIDAASLRNNLNQKINDLNEDVLYERDDVFVIERTLTLLLEPNVIFDAAATDNARQAADNRVLNNPVMSEIVTRIVAMDEVITEEMYSLLEDLDLINSGQFDYYHLAGIFLLLLLVVGIAAFYIRHYEKESISSARDMVALLLSLIIPLLISVTITRYATLSPPVYFAAVLIASYFGFRAAVILSLCLSVLILPMTNFNPIFLAVAMIGSLVAALFAKGIIRKDNYAFIILATSGANILTAFSFSIMLKEAWSDVVLNSGYAAVSGALSVIAAIGLMPLFEMLFNSVSPMRLIELSQPGHPLLRRLFVEAPGSSQHSMMVANLADSAAVAINADALLARVGAYYHDIG